MTPHRTMQRRRGSAMAFILLLAAALTAAPAEGANLTTGERDLAARQALSLVSSVREGVASGSLAGALAAVMESRAATASPTAERVVLPAGVPASLEGPVGRLMAAVSRARSAAEAARNAPLRVAEGLIAELNRFRANARPAAPGFQARLEDLRRRAERVVDRAAMEAAALELARSIDVAVPALREYARGLPVRDERVVGCDVVPLAPALCVGGTGANEYTEDAALNIDLGGDDLYRNAAGAGTPLLAASVVLDLGGNDRYESTTGRSVAQGSGLLGIGILHDLAGNDRYSVTTTPGPAGQLTGQAYAAFGVGVLADGGGDDTYETSITTPMSQSVLVKGQGYAEFASTAMLLDVGGNDSYSVRAAPSLIDPGTGEIRPVGATAGGLGFGIIGGTGVVADSGGADRITLEAATSPVPPEHPAAQVGDSPAATAQGIGWGLQGGIGLALSGDGPTTWTIRATGAAPRVGRAAVEGMGHATFGATGAVEDLGGDDTYLAEAVAAAAQRRVLSDGCGCASARADAFAGAASVTAQGAGLIGGAGLLRDGGGADSYTLRATSSAGAETGDHRSDAGEGVVTAVGTADAADAAGQGYGLLGGSGVIQDLRGDDLYAAWAESDAAAGAFSPHPETVRLGAAEAKAARSGAQARGVAGGRGELVDLGGSDRYESVNRSTASADPEGNETTGQVSASVQASVGGEFSTAPSTLGVALLTDTDVGGYDVFTSEPSGAACEGTRGQGVWRDCGPGAGIGVNP